MRIKYKAPNQFFYRRFWRVTQWSQCADGSFWAENKGGRKLFLPAGMCVVVVNAFGGK